MLAATSAAALLASASLASNGRAFPGMATATQFPDPVDMMLKARPMHDGAVAFKLSATLQDHMVLQREPAAAVVWGFAPEGTTVDTVFAGHTITATADNTSVWRAKLPPTPATKTPQTITFTASTGENATLSDVLFGDVYVCGGAFPVPRACVRACVPACLPPACAHRRALHSFVRHSMHGCWSCLPRIVRHCAANV
jgi:hypothetical protein